MFKIQHFVDGWHGVARQMEIGKPCNYKKQDSTKAEYKRAHITFTHGKHANFSTTNFLSQKNWHQKTRKSALK